MASLSPNIEPGYPMRQLAIAPLPHKLSPELAPRNAAQAGFTYVGVLILIAVIGMAAASTLQVGALLQRRAAEEALLDIGAQFQQALNSYAQATPAGQSRMPASLQDLLKDPRYPVVKRHLRRIYIDPITGKDEWGIVAMPDGKGILGVHSFSEERPIKLANFDDAFAGFGGKTSYRQWRFMGPVFFAPPK